MDNQHQLVIQFRCKMKELFIELRIQEIPSDTINNMEKDFRDGILEGLNNLKTPFGDVESGSTPRRIWIAVSNIPLTQSDRVETITGPPTSVAYKSDGSLGVPGVKFLERNEIDESQLEVITSQGKDIIAYIKNIKGLATESLIPEVFQTGLNNLKPKRSMQWGSHTTKFIRPLENVICLFDGKVIANLKISEDGIPVNNTTLGHRFHSSDQKGSTQIVVSSSSQYIQSMKEYGVLPTYNERLELITTLLTDIHIPNSKELGVSSSTHMVELDTDLLAETANLVEFPYPILGTFDEKFLKLPKCVLTTTMKVHQRFFSVLDRDDSISNYFVGISNNKYHTNIQMGYERVINARLYDALFFYESDLKVPFNEMAIKLEKIVFMRGLGDMLQKVERVESLTSILPATIGLHGLDIDLSRAAMLCKADLVSAMVYEFPELQGYMGQDYAKNFGENERVALSIREHYLPRSFEDSLPTSHLGALLSIADKIDSICGAFISGVPPTGSADPLGIRRQAIGVLRILENMAYTLPLLPLIKESIAIYRSITQVEPIPESDKKYLGDDTHIANLILEFFETRMLSLHSKGITAKFIQATFQLSYSVKEDLALATTLHQMHEGDDSSDLESFTLVSDTFKRINNILQKSKDSIPSNYTKSLFCEPEESALAESMERLRGIIDKALMDKEYKLAIETALLSAPYIDAFFEKVMVNHEDDDIRSNRLSLLQSVRRLLTLVGDWNRL